MPKPEQTSGPWLGWPGLCRGVTFKGVGVGVRMHASTNYFVLPLFLRPSHPEAGRAGKTLLFIALRPMESPKGEQARVTIPGSTSFYLIAVSPQKTPA